MSNKPPKPFPWHRLILYAMAGVLLIWGGMIYLLYRSTTIKLFGWLDIIGLYEPVMEMRQLLQQDAHSTFVLYSLPDALWLCSYLLIANATISIRDIRSYLVWTLLVPSLAIVHELMQKWGLMPGTFDVIDLLSYSIPIFINLLILIMKKLFQFRTMAMAAVTALFVVMAAGSDEPTPKDPEVTPTIPTLDGVVKVDAGIPGFDAAYASNEGFFCQNTDMQPAEGNQYTTVTYLTTDLSDIVSIVARKDNSIPSQLVTRNETVYFSFPNDTILEVLAGKDGDAKLVETVAYVKNELPSATKYSDDSFRGIIGNVAQLLNGSAHATLANYANIFGKVVSQNYVDASEYLAQLKKDSDGNYAFAKEALTWYNQHINIDFYNTIFLWTGNATFKVGGSSCTLSGTIWCPSGNYNDYGTYGIICDSDPAKLTVDNAEYKGAGFQAPFSLSYDVDFRGFKPNTTYYYRAYYQFNSSNHGQIITQMGNGDVIYDKTVKSFTTGDNNLTVDVVMCIDVTGSMSSIISTVKHNALGFYDAFKACCDKNDIGLTGLNVRVISFRDMLVDSEWITESRTFVLPDETDEYKNTVNSFYAYGGGDTPESGMEALMTAFNNPDWSVDDGYHRQVVILWTDASFLYGEEWSLYTAAQVEEKWNTLPSGRRLILFAPYGTYDYNGCSWGVLDTWKNVIHVDDLSSGFNNFEYILESIIGELTSKAPAKAPARNVKSQAPYFFQPNN